MAFHDLCEALETLLLQHEQMLTFAQQKKEALISNDVNVITEMVNKESRLVKLILETEARRQKAVSAFLVEKGLAQLPDIKITDLIRMITHAEDKLRLSDLSDRLIQAVEDLKALNAINVRLTQQAIEFNDFSLSLLTGMYDDQDYVYKNPSNQSRDKTNLTFFDSKA